MKRDLLVQTILVQVLRWTRRSLTRGSGRVDLPSGRSFQFRARLPLPVSHTEIPGNTDRETRQRAAIREERGRTRCDSPEPKHS